MGKAKKARATKGKSKPATAAEARQAPAAAKSGASAGNTSAESAPRPKKIGNKRYETELFRLQVELVKMLEWIKHEGL